MAHTPETRKAVRDGYVVDKLTLEDAAARTGVSIATARRWKLDAETSGDDWERAKFAATLSAAGVESVAKVILHDYMLLHQATVEALMSGQTIEPLKRAEAMSRMADSFTKTMSAVAKAAPDLGRYAVAAELIDLLIKFVSEKYPQHRRALAEFIEPFGASIAQRYG